MNQKYEVLPSCLPISFTDYNHTVFSFFFSQKAQSSGLYYKWQNSVLKMMLGILRSVFSLWHETTFPLVAMLGSQLEI